MSKVSHKSSDMNGGLDTPNKPEELAITDSLEDLQTEEQRQVLDTVARVRKCGLDSILSLPQLVVCGDQSAGKSSVLEALTEIPFPRNDNLCTRYATEIDLRRGDVNILTIKVIPDGNRPATEKGVIEAFHETITDFSELPKVMDLATTAMGISDTDTVDSGGRAFARDVLSIQIEGPHRPQLTLVDIPGLIQTSTKGVSDADVDVVAEITESYIRSPRTICLAVVSATNDAANQPILRKVRQVDPEGDRTLGIITKPDRLPPGSGSESKFLELARNEDVFFRLGWHVLKNRSFEEANYSLDERNASEAKYFRTSGFNTLAKENLGIDALRFRLSRLLFEHVKQELPKLRQDLENALQEANDGLGLLGKRRSDAMECKTYLTHLSLDYYEVSKAAVNGHYEGAYFHQTAMSAFSVQSPATFIRLRAVVQHLNNRFCNTIRTSGHKYQIQMHPVPPIPSPPGKGDLNSSRPVHMSKDEAFKWVRNALDHIRGKELVGNFNPLVIGELLWEQASHWSQLAKDHIEQLDKVCGSFVKHLLEEKCPRDVYARLWSHRISHALKARRDAAIGELERILEDLEGFPINYNHYYTDTIHKNRKGRQKTSLAKALKAGTQHQRLPDCHSNHTSASIDIDTVISNLSNEADPDMENFSCEEILDCLFAIYKVTQKIFVANVTTQVIERHIVRGLECIFSPVVISAMSDKDVEAIASEPQATQRQRGFLEDRVRKLQEGQEIFRRVLGGGASIL